MTAAQLELPLFPETVGHSALIRWDPRGKPDGTYTVTCDCDGAPQISHTWKGMQARFLQHCSGETS